MDEKLSLPELIGWLLHKHNLSAEGLAELLGVHPETLEWWMAGRQADMACTETLLELLHQVPDRILPLLSQRAEDPEGDGASWSAKIKAARQATGLEKVDFAGFLGASHQAVRRWEDGGAPPRGCYAVVIDLLYRHPSEMIELFHMISPPRPPEQPWTRKRLVSLMAKLGATTRDFATLIGVEPQRVTKWMSGGGVPNVCTVFLLKLLEAFPAETAKLLRLRVIEDWPPERVKAARGKLSAFDIQALTGIDEGSIYRWESEGLPTKYRCPAIVYGILERYPRMLLEMADALFE